MKIFIVEDHPMVCRGLRMLLGLEPDFCVCGEANTQKRALEEIPRRQPDLAILDLRLKRGSGLALISQLRARCPALKILVFSLHAEQVNIDQALAAGAHAFVAKEEGSAKAVATIRRLARTSRQPTKPRTPGAGKPGLPEANPASGGRRVVSPVNPFRQ